MAVLLLIIQKKSFGGPLDEVVPGFSAVPQQKSLRLDPSNETAKHQTEFDLQLSGEQAPDIRSKHAHHFIPGKH